MKNRRNFQRNQTNVTTPRSNTEYSSDMMALVELIRFKVNDSYANSLSCHIPVDNNIIALIIIIHFSRKWSNMSLEHP